jgi:hypothetical protein
MMISAVVFSVALRAHRAANKSNEFSTLHVSAKAKPKHSIGSI